MSSYQEITRQIGDQCVDTIKRAQDAVTEFAQTVADPYVKLSASQVQEPEQLAKLREAIMAQFPKPSEIVQANFEFTERLLAAQKELTLTVLAAAADQLAAAGEATSKA